MGLQRAARFPAGAVLPHFVLNRLNVDINCDLQLVYAMINVLCFLPRSGAYERYHNRQPDHGYP